MSKEEAAGVEGLSQTTSPPLYFPYCLSCASALSFTSLFRDYFFMCTCFQHPSTAATLSFSALIKASERLGLLLHS